MLSFRDLVEKAFRSTVIHVKGPDRNRVSMFLDHYNVMFQIDVSDKVHAGYAINIIGMDKDDVEILIKDMESQGMKIKK